MRSRLSVYSDRMACERVADFVQNRMRMSRVYQPVMLMTLLLKMTDDLVGGAA
jgi:hypothetical protein